MKIQKIVKKWKHEGLRCQVILNEHEWSKWYCGYVAVSRSNRLWRVTHNDEELWDLDVHGGITLTDRGEAKTLWTNKKLWWFGFDCAHGGDKIYKEAYYQQTPKLMRLEMPQHTWNLEEVVEETNKLAEQLAKREEDYRG